MRLCTRATVGTDPIDPVAAKCPDCGHQLCLHPGLSNDNLEACIGCVVNAMQQKEEDDRLVGQSPQRPEGYATDT
jgi:hypothetical protein